MSCPSSQNSRNFNVSAGSLPEGYCPNTWQDFLNDLAARLLVTSPTNNSSFATGSTAPTSNVGPWLKNCEEWFVFNDATGLYVPITKGGFNTFQYIESSQNFTVPDGIFKLKIHAFGGGGGGSNTDGSASKGSGGGGGAYGCSIVSVLPAQVIAVVIGNGGPNGVTGTNGGDTTILGHTAGGGKGAGPTIQDSGDGGVATGFDINLSGQGGMANCGASATTGGQSGGDAGGWGGKGGAIKGNATPRNGTSPGGGGSGGTNSAGGVGGSGANGSILIEW